MRFARARSIRPIIATFTDAPSEGKVIQTLARLKRELETPRSWVTAIVAP